MAVLVELTQEECLELLRTQSVGRVAVCTPEGPRIVPVNYTVLGSSVVVRTAPYTVLGTFGRDALLALETDQLEPSMQVGWSVVVQGRATMVEDTEELAHIRTLADPQPWAGGTRPLYLRLRWREISGRRVSGSAPR